MSVNYVKELAKARDNYNSTAEKLRQSYEKDLQNREETNNHRFSKLKENHDFQQNALKQETDDRVDLIGNKTQKLLKDRRNRFQTILADRNSEQVKERSRLRRGYQNRLAEIKDSYEKAQKEYEFLSDQKVENLNRNFKEVSAANRKNYNNSIKLAEEETKQSIQEAKAKLNEQKNTLVKKNREEKMDLTRRMTQEVNDQQDYYQRKFDDVRDAKEEELRRIRGHFDAAMNTSKADDRDVINRLDRSYKMGLTELQTKSNNDYKKMQQKFLKLSQQKDQKHERQMYLRKKETDEFVDRSLKGAGVEFQKERLKDTYEHRLESMRNQMADMSTKFERDVQKLQQSIDDQLKEKSLIHQKKLDERDEDYRDSMNTYNEKSRKKQSQIVNSYQRELTNRDLYREEMVKGMSREHQQTMASRKAAYSESIDRMTDDNIKNVVEMQKDFAEEKTDIVTSFRKQMEKQNKWHREEILDKTDALIKQFNQRISDKDREITRLKNEKELKLASIERTSRQKIENETLMNKEKRDIDRQQLRTQMDDMKKMYERKIQTIRRQHDENLSRAKSTYDANMTKLTHRHANESQQRITQHQTEMKRKLSVLQQQLDRQMKDSKFQYDTMVTNYERRIKDLKKEFEIKMMNEYKNNKNLT